MSHSSVDSQAVTAPGAVKAARTEPERLDFTLLWTGSAVSQAGNMAAATATPLLLLSLTDSPMVASFATMAVTLPELLVRLPAGLITDAYDRRRIMRVVQTARMVVGVGMLACVGLLDDPVPYLLIALFLEGGLATVYLTAETPAIRHVSAHGEVSRNMAKNEALLHVAISLGRPIGGLLYGWGRFWPYLVAALTSLFSLGTLQAVRVKSFQKAEPTGLNRADASEFWREQKAAFGSGLRQVLTDRFLGLCVALCTGANFIFQIVFLLLLVRAQQAGLSSTVFGLLLATSGLAGVAGAATAPWLLRHGVRGTVAVVCAWVWTGLVAVAVFSDDPRYGLAAWGACSFVGAHMNVGLAIQEVRTIPDAMLGRITSFIQLVTGAAVPIGAACAGVLVHTAPSTNVWVEDLTFRAMLVFALLASLHLLWKNRVFAVERGGEARRWVRNRMRAWARTRVERRSAG